MQIYVHLSRREQKEIPYFTYLMGWSHLARSNHVWLLILIRGHRLHLLASPLHWLAHSFHPATKLGRFSLWRGVRSVNSNVYSTITPPWMRLAYLPHIHLLQHTAKTIRCHQHNSLKLKPQCSHCRNWLKNTTNFRLIKHLGKDLSTSQKCREFRYSILCFLLFL